MRRIFFLVSFLVSLTVGFSSYAQDFSGDGTRTLSPFFFISSDDETDSLPLASSYVDVDISGSIASVKIEQTYKNEGKNTIEAVYVFPMSTLAAVHSMKMTVGKRKIEAKIKQRKEARRIYKEAKDAGKTASLLEQERTNVFQMNVANINPGDEILIELTYTELIVPQEKIYEFVFPTVVGPRYSNIRADDTTEDDEWTETPYTHEGAPATFDFDIELNLSSAIPIATIDCPTHKTGMERPDPNTAKIWLDEDDSNRDFILRYSLAGNTVQTGVLTYSGKNENFFMVVVEPPKRIIPKQVLPREYIFIVDVSGSMHGFPLDVTKRLMRDIFYGLDENDWFNVMLFAGGSATLAPKSLRATKENVATAVSWLQSASGGGGTEILPALKKAFNLPKHEGTSRIVVVASDGFVTVEKEAFELVKNNLGEANLFSFGIGSSVNRLLIEGLARAGAGEPFVVVDQLEAKSTADRFGRYISSPLLKNIDVKFQGFDAYSVEPSPHGIPDLFADRPLVIFGKYRGQAKGKITITGHSAQGKWSRQIDVSGAKPSKSNNALRYLWARHRIEQLSDEMGLFEGWGVPVKATPEKNAIIKLSMKYNLMTQFTSFVAVDDSVRARTKAKKVNQPLPMPDGVSDLAVGGLNNIDYGFGAMPAAGAAITAGASAALSVQLGNSENAQGHLVGANLGSGSGSGFGSGSGYGRGHGGLGGRRGSRPCIRSGAAMVRGSMAKEIIARIMKRQNNKIKGCYNQGLLENPDLAGRIVIKFIINANGQVIASVVAQSTLDDSKVEQCIVNTVKGISFPSPSGGGIVVVNYPFQLQSESK